MNIRSVLKYTQFFSLWVTYFGNRALKTVKLWESNVLNCCLKMTADLRKIGRKMRE